MGKRSKKDKERFVSMYLQRKMMTNIEILLDKETGVHYLSVQASLGVGLTVLLDKDGKPVIAAKK